MGNVGPICQSNFLTSNQTDEFVSRFLFVKYYILLILYSIFLGELTKSQNDLLPARNVQESPEVEGDSVQEVSGV